MNISGNLVSSQKSYQQWFNGYIDKPVMKIINKACKMEAQFIINDANVHAKKANPEQLGQLKDLHKSVIEKLDTFMKKLHPDTTLTLEDQKFIFKNTKLNKSLDIEIYPDGGGGVDFYRKTIDLENPAKEMRTRGYFNDSLLSLTQRVDLKRFEKFANNLTEKVDAKLIDKAMFAQFTKEIKDQVSDAGLFGLLRTKRNIKKAGKIAPEFGDKTNWKEELNAIRNEFLKKESIIRQNSKENKQKYKNFINEIE